MTAARKMIRNPSHSYPGVNPSNNLDLADRPQIVMPRARKEPVKKLPIMCFAVFFLSLRSS